MSADPPMVVEVVVSETVTPPRPDEHLDFTDEERAESRRHWDGVLPPPAVLRCTGTRHTVYASGLECFAACRCLGGHPPPCDFSKANEVQA